MLNITTHIRCFLHGGAVQMRRPRATATSPVARLPTSSVGIFQPLRLAPRRLRRTPSSRGSFSASAAVALPSTQQRFPIGKTGKSLTLSLENKQLVLDSTQAEGLIMHWGFLLDGVDGWQARSYSFVLQ